MRKPIGDYLVGFRWLEGGCILWFLFFFADLFGSEDIFCYICRRLLLIIGAFGHQSSMKNVAIISCSVGSLFR